MDVAQPLVVPGLELEVVAEALADFRAVALGDRLQFRLVIGGKRAGETEIGVGLVLP